MQFLFAVWCLLWTTDIWSSRKSMLIANCNRVKFHVLCVCYCVMLSCTFLYFAAVLDYWSSFRFIYQWIFALCVHFQLKYAVQRVHWQIMQQLWWRWALRSLDGVASSRMVSVNLPLHHKIQKFSSGTGSPGWSRKRAVKRLCVCAVAFNFCYPMVLQLTHSLLRMTSWES